MLGHLARTLAVISTVLTVPVLSVSFNYPGDAATIAPADTAAAAPIVAAAKLAAPAKPMTPVAAFKKECSACHNIFSPGFLPQRSWQAITADLSNHFGEDASLDPATTATITAFLVSRAGDAGGKANNWVRRIPKNKTPLRITQTPTWLGIHGGFVNSPRMKQARSPGNCAFCHGG